MCRSAQDNSPKHDHTTTPHNMTTTLAVLLVILLLPVVLLLYVTEDNKHKARRMASKGIRHKHIAQRFNVSTQQVTAWCRA